MDSINPSIQISSGGSICHKRNILRWIRGMWKNLLVRLLSLAPALLLSSEQMVNAIPEKSLQGSPAQLKSKQERADQVKPAKSRIEPERTLSETERKAANASLKSLRLRSPIEGFDLQRIKYSFAEKRGEEAHHAADFLAERNTPVVAVSDGKIAKLFISKTGGITIYQFDPSERYVFYYAHLEKYADGLVDGKLVRKGEQIGFVGSSGNAPPNTPHLHFSIGVMDIDKKWWEAVEVDPFEVLLDK